MKNRKLNNVVIRINSNATVICEEEYEDNIIKSKFLRVQDLYEAIKASGVLVGIDSGILPEGCVFYRQDAENNVFVVIKHTGKVDFKLEDAVFKNFPLPTMLFGFKIVPGGHVSERLLTCIKGSRVRMDTKLCKYPFSNVYNDHRMCLGGNRLKNIDYIYQIESFPYLIMSMNNNKDLYTIKNNQLGLAYMDLLEHISKQDVFDESLLMESDQTVKDFIGRLVGTSVQDVSVSNITNNIAG